MEGERSNYEPYFSHTKQKGDSARHVEEMELKISPVLARIFPAAIGSEAPCGRSEGRHVLHCAQRLAASQIHSCAARSCSDSRLESAQRLSASQIHSQQPAAQVLFVPSGVLNAFSASQITSHVRVLVDDYVIDVLNAF